MTEEDDVFLKIFNQKRDPSNQCSEDDFEATMNFFEETAQAKQPYAAVDSPPVLSFKDMEEAMDAAVEESVKRFAKDIYEHWKSRRAANGNQSLVPSLKVSILQYWVFRKHPQADSLCSSKPVKTPTTVIRMSVSAGARFARSARLVVEMRRALKSFGDFVKSLRMLGNWLRWCANARSLGRR